MFRGLRLGMTALYMVAALALITLVGAGTYRLIDSYLSGGTDLALQHVLAQDLTVLGLPVSSEIAAADRDWYSSRGHSVPASAGQGAPAGGESHDEDDRATGQGGLHIDDHAYDPELAAIFVLPLSADGQVTLGRGITASSAIADKEAVAAAMSSGIDWRTVNLSNGIRVRLLTYRLPEGVGPAALQLGRTLTDQDQVLRQLLLGLVALGGVSTVLLGVASWLLAGRSLRPAQQAWERQQSFVANASHELRTPLTLMRATAEVAQRSTPAADIEQRALLGDIIQESDHMSHLVEDLLLLSRIDSGKLAVERTPIQVPDMLADVQRQVGRVAVEKNVEVNLAQAGGTVLGDVTRLRQVLLILLDNALKHTPAGGRIVLEAYQHGRNVLISVADTGSGIAAEHLPHIFERFYRVDSARGVEGGSGLGLSIAKALVEAQHGQISAESRPNFGTRMTIALPAAR